MHATSRAISMILACAAAACGGGDDPGDDTGDPQDDPQLPPLGHDAVTTWISAGHYLAWACEPDPHPAREPSPHGINRICSNAAVAAGATGTAYPVGSAAVKELRDDGGAIIGHAVYRKLRDAGDGDNWYWYETVAGDVIADGEGTGGPAREICVDCHSHAPTDFVFTRVQ